MLQVLLYLNVSLVLFLVSSATQKHPGRVLVHKNTNLESTCVFCRIEIDKSQTPSRVHKATCLQSLFIICPLAEITNLFGGLLVSLLLSNSQGGSVLESHDLTTMGSHGDGIASVEVIPGLLDE